MHGPDGNRRTVFTTVSVTSLILLVLLAAYGSLHSVWVKSHFGEGATFLFTVPQA